LCSQAPVTSISKTASASSSTRSRIRGKTLFRDDIDRASEPVLKEVFHRDQIDQTKACVSNDLDEHVHIASGSGVTPGE